MKYISDDGKVFNTEQECCEHEQKIKKVRAEEIIKRKQLATERKNILDQICQKRKELMELYGIYENKFGVTIGEYLPFSEFLKVLYGI